MIQSQFVWINLPKKCIRIFVIICSFSAIWSENNNLKKYVSGLELFDKSNLNIFFYLAFEYNSSTTIFLYRSDSILLENLLWFVSSLGANPFCDMMDGISFSCKLKWTTEFFLKLWYVHLQRYCLHSLTWNMFPYEMKSDMQRDRRRGALLQHQNFNFLFYLGWSGCFT